MEGVCGSDFRFSIVSGMSVSDAEWARVALGLLVAAVPGEVQIGLMSGKAGFLGVCEFSRAQLGFFYPQSAIRNAIWGSNMRKRRNSSAPSQKY